jgi:hypothetical protein
LSKSIQKKKTRVQSLIENIKTVNIPLSKIDLDPTNPNKMSENQMESLERIMKKYHYATEAWINTKTKGRYKMIDGEHRYLILEKHHINTIPCKIFKVSEVEAKILRQIANKFRGEHDFEKDALEFKAIYDDKKLDELADMLVQPVEYFQQILELQFAIPSTEFETNREFSKKEWEGMPEFAQEDMDAFRRIILKFDSEEDVQKFGKVLNQNISENTKAMWFPYKPWVRTTTTWADTNEPDKSKA